MNVDSISNGNFLHKRQMKGRTEKKNYLNGIHFLYELEYGEIARSERKRIVNVTSVVLCMHHLTQVKII